MIATSLPHQRSSHFYFKVKHPLKCFFHKQPSYDHLLVFGCCALPQHTQKGYKVYNIPFGKVLISRDVIFHEDIFPLSSFAVNSPSKPHHSTTYDDDKAILHFSPETEVFSLDHLPQEEPQSHSNSKAPSQVIHSTARSSSIDQHTPKSLPLDQQIPPSQSTYTTKTPGYLNEYQVGISLPS